MSAHSESVRFQSYEKFFEAIAEGGRASDGGPVCRWKDSFATIETEVYQLSADVQLKFFGIWPTKDIHIPYEFNDDHFEVTYGVSGNFVLEDEYCGCHVFSVNHLSLTQKLRSRGNMIFCRGQVFRGIIFDASGETINTLFGEIGSLLWMEATRADNFDERKRMYIGTAAPWNIAASFLQIAGCDYPHRIKHLFFESKFKEILVRIIASNLPNEEPSQDVKVFEAERIKKIPLILTERADAPPSISELARELSLNTTTMKREFKNMFGVPIYAYHRNLCLERAAMMLRDTSNSIAEIAVKNGYSGSVSFCGAFKKRYGLSPNRYRRIQKGTLLF
jgi:AraC-like DNA-binding protein